MAKKNEYASYIYDMRNNIQKNNDLPAVSPVTMIIDGEDIFVLLTVQPYYSWRLSPFFALAFHYDFETDSYSYIGFCDTHQLGFGDAKIVLIIES